MPGGGPPKGCSIPWRVWGAGRVPPMSLPPPEAHSKVRDFAGWRRFSQRCPFPLPSSFYVRPPQTQRKQHPLCRHHPVGVSFSLRVQRTLPFNLHSPHTWGVSARCFSFRVVHFFSFLVFHYFTCSGGRSGMSEHCEFWIELMWHWCLISSRWVTKFSGNWTKGQRF